MVPKEGGFNQSETDCGLCACIARLQWQGMVNLYKHSIFVITETQFTIQIQVTQQPNYTKRRHVDVTIKRSFRKEIFSHFLPSTYAGHVSLAAHKPW